MRKNDMVIICEVCGKKISKALSGKSRPSMLGSKNNRDIFGCNNPMKDPEIVKKLLYKKSKENKNGL